MVMIIELNMDIKSGSPFQKQQISNSKITCSAPRKEIAIMLFPAKK